MTSFRSVWAISCVLFLAEAVHAQATFRNPVIPGMNPDPSICRAGDDYYLVTSTFEYFPGLPIYKSKDLVHWKLIGHALSRASSNPLMGCNSGTGGQYAPTIRYHDGTFYVIGTNYGGRGTQGVFYVTATDPAGRWSDPLWLGEWYVDPSLLFADGSIYYLSPDNKESFLLGTINAQKGLFVKPATRVAGGLGGSSPEGPHLYMKDDFYYLMSAEGGTGYDHREVIQRSKSPWGSYEPSPTNPIVSHREDPNNPFQAIGHADLIETPDGWWLVCLGFRPKGGNYHHLGRETFLAPVTWTTDGWPTVGENGIVEEEYPSPNLPQHIWEKDPVRDDFENDTLRLSWNFIRNPHDDNWSLTDSPGALRLNGSKISFKEKDSPAFVCRRQTAFNVVASTTVSFVPTASNEEAGLVIRGDDKNHYDLLITMRSGKRVILFRKCLLGEVDEVAIKEILPGDIILGVSASDLQYSFWTKQGGEVANLLGSARTKDLSTEVIGGFTGVFVGMYASGNGFENTNPADFDWFQYEENPTSLAYWPKANSARSNAQ